MTYLFNKNTPWLNNVVLGTDLTKSPEIATLVETKKMRKSVDTFIDTESRERKESHKTTQNLSQAVQMGFQNFSTNLSNDMQQTHYQLDNVNQEINSLSYSVNDGLSSMKESMEKNNEIVEEGFYNIQNSIEENTFKVTQGMKNGFAGVIKSIFTTNHKLGQNIAVGFDNINQSQQQTTEAITQLDRNLVKGFNALQSDRLATSKILDRGFIKVQSTLAEGFANHQIAMLKEGELTRETMVDVGNHIGQQISQSYELIANQQHEFKNALINGFNQTFEQLSSIGMITSQLREDINYNFNIVQKSLQGLGQDIRQQKRHFATDSFQVGFRYMNAMMLDSAKKEFDRALDEFGGHFPTLISYGYLSMLENDSTSAKKWYGKAVIQAGHNGDERKERAVAQLHLARIYNSEDNLQEAIIQYKSAFANNPNLISALIEESVCHFRLAQNDKEMQYVGKAIRDRFDSEDENSSNLWYFFALEIVDFDKDVAVNAMQQGISRDNLTPKNSADRIKDKLFQLNSTKYPHLMRELRKYGEFDWLF